MNVEKYEYDVIRKDDGVLVTFPAFPGVAGWAMSEEAAFQEAKRQLVTLLTALEDGQTCPDHPRVYL